jgi:uncharacterized membrane protein
MRGAAAGRASVARFAAGRSGNFATLTALLAPVGFVLGAVAIDSASLYAQRRDVQALADLAAITAAAHVGTADQAAVAALEDNGVRRIALRGSDGVTEIGAGAAGAPVSLSVTTGRYRGRPDTPVGARFVAGAAPPDAVRVTLGRKGTRFFSASLIPPPHIATSAVASAPARATVSIGSRLLGLDGGLANAVLGGLTGSRLSLTAMDYEALAKADVDAFRFTESLASELHLTAGTYSDVLASRATVGQVASAIAAVSGTDRSATTAARLFARDAGGNGTKIDIGRLIDLGPAASLPLGQPPAGLGAAVGALDLIGAAAALSNGADQARIDLATAIPGLASATLELAIGEPPQSSPWFTVGEAGDVVRTAQTRLLLTVGIGGPGGLLGASVRLPLYAEAAYAEASLAEVDCAGRRVSVVAKPGVARLRIADADALSDFGRDPSFAPARLVEAPLLTVTGSAYAAVTNLASARLVFSDADIVKRTVKSVSTADFTQSLTQSLLGSLDLRLNGTGVLPAPLRTILSDLLATTAPAVDRLLDGVLAVLGIRLGEADVRVTGVACGRSVLVQ